MFKMLRWLADVVGIAGLFAAVKTAAGKGAQVMGTATTTFKSISQAQKALDEFFGKTKFIDERMTSLLLEQLQQVDGNAFTVFLQRMSRLSKDQADYCRQCFLQEKPEDSLKVVMMIALMTEAEWLQFLDSQGIKMSAKDFLTKHSKSLGAFSVQKFGELMVEVNRIGNDPRLASHADDFLSRQKAKLAARSAKP